MGHRRFGSRLSVTKSGHLLCCFLLQIQMDSKHAHVLAPSFLTAPRDGRTIGDIGAPNLIGTGDRKAPEQVGILLVRRIGDRQILLGVNGRNPHNIH